MFVNSSLLLLLAVAPAEGLPYYGEATFTPQWLKASQISKDFHRIPAFEFTNQKGESVTEKSFEGKIYVADFFFTTCPGICADMSKNMLILQEAFQGAEDVRLLSHSVTPDHDTPKRLARYARRYGIDARLWHLVPGPEKLIYDLGRRRYFVEEDLGLKKKDDEFLHTENFVLIDKIRRIRGIYNGLNKASIAQLIEDIKTLRKEG